jgi:hypothetical protein
MNDRIREPYYSIMYKASEGWNDHLFQVPPELLEKFAELIIQECRNVITDFDGVENYEYIMNPRTIRYECDCEIRDHFGLEE